MKILIYSAEFGNYETDLNQPVEHDPGQDMIYSYKRFSTNQRRNTPGTWHHVEPIYTSRDMVLYPQYQARFHKTDPSAILHDFRQYDYTIWVDASMQLLADPMELVHLLGDYDLMTFKHRHRTTITEEGLTVVKIKNQSAEAIRKQINFYRQADYNDFVPLPETGLMIRRINSRVLRFNKFWWNQIRTFCVRDQMSFGFSAWKTGVRVGYFPGHVRSGKLNTLNHHRRKQCPKT